MRTSTLCSLPLFLSGVLAFAPPPQRISRRTDAAVGSTVESPASADASSPPPAASADASSSPSNRNKPDWDVKQHLYGLDMIADEAVSSTMSVTVNADGEVAGSEGSLPLPDTYITCGKCKSLFAIAEEDLGNKGKGCRVKCSVCGNSWYQSRDRLFDIPADTHDMSPAARSDLDRIARNLSKDFPPHFSGVNKLYVGNLDWRTTSEELTEFFESNATKEGEDKPVELCDVSIVTGPDGRSRGFAFVSFYEESDGKAALGCNGLECNGRELAVREPNN